MRIIDYDFSDGEKNLRWTDAHTARTLINAWGCRPDAFFFLFSYDMSKCLVKRIEDIPTDELQLVFPQMNNISSEEQQSHCSPLTWQPHYLSEADYWRKFSIVHQNMLAGNSYLANLTCRTPIETNLTLHEIFCRSKALYKIWLKDSFVCFSPETFVRIDRKGLISSCPMKGTISCSVPNASQVLMNDVKEAAEHATIVDLIRNDLSKVAGNVTVKRYRYVERLHTNCGDILQTSSEIVGQLPPDYHRHLGDIIMDQLPAGSITGAPKRKTVEIIRQAEGYDRGFYTGVAGVCKDGVIDSCVLIRFIDNENGRLYFKAGGGITAKSDWKKEYQEIKEKTYVPFC